MDEVDGGKRRGAKKATKAGATRARKDNAAAAETKKTRRPRKQKEEDSAPKATLSLEEETRPEEIDVCEPQRPSALVICTVRAHYGGDKEDVLHINFFTRDGVPNTELTVDTPEEQFVAYLLRLLMPERLPELRTLEVTFFGERPRWMAVTDVDERTVIYPIAEK